jgi:hypothetical protein
VGLATDFRLESKKVTGFALTLNEQILHISIFAREEGGDRHGADSRVERFSKRRGNRRA